MYSPSISRYDIATGILFVAGLLGLLTVHLLPSLLAGLLVAVGFALHLFGSILLPFVAA